MSLATRCPGCATVFRVSTQDATARGGTVRCGVCGTVFNALNALVQASETRVATGSTHDVMHALIHDDASPVMEPASTFADSAGSDMESRTEPMLEPNVEFSVEDHHIKETNIEGGPGDQSSFAISETNIEQRLHDAPPPSSEIEAVAETHSETSSEGRDETTSETATEAVYDGAFRETQPAFVDAPSAASAETRAETESASASSQLDPLLTSPHFSGFNPDAHTRSTQRSWIIVLALAALMLAAQSLYVWRNAIAAAWPAAQPVLQQACAHIGCRLDLPMAIDQLSIESSELQAVPESKERYSFNALLRSRSSSPLRYPAIELTLTDALNQIVARRVLLPEQYLDASQRRLIAQGLRANAELPLKITFDVAGTPIIGYRVGLLYP